MHRAAQAFRSLLEDAALEDRLAARAQHAMRMKCVYRAFEQLLEEADVARDVTGSTASRMDAMHEAIRVVVVCLLYTSPSPRDRQKSRMPSSA